MYKEVYNPDYLKAAAEKYAGAPCIAADELPKSGSSRVYVRFTFQNFPSIIGAYNQDVKENEAFFSYTRFFLTRNINVPQLLWVDGGKRYYLLSDLGNETLYSFLSSHRDGQELGAETIHYYREVIKQLPLIQLSGKCGIDFSVAYPRYAFDRQSMQWDLNYFKYYFLKLVNIPFDEQLLENDFDTLINYLLQADSDFFLFRDFQSRNIMICDDKVYFIDYQGGRKGALQYDIASLLYDGKADIPAEVREQLLDFYMDELSKHIPVDRRDFKERYTAFVLIRIMQAMGAYGFRGYYEKKAHFLLSIPYAVNNIKYLLAHWDIPVQIPALREVLRKITECDFESYSKQNTDKLTVTITSFSYKKGIPQDLSANGGGFVFDCRALPNPGREKQYSHNTGQEKVIIDWLEKYPEVEEFKSHVNAIVDMSVENYMSRHFTHLMVNFGCTGGQHRSVYFAESLKKHLEEKYDVAIVLKHTVIDSWTK